MRYTPSRALLRRYTKVFVSWVGTLLCLGVLLLKAEHPLYSQTAATLTTRSDGISLALEENPPLNTLRTIASLTEGKTELIVDLQTLGALLMKRYNSDSDDLTKLVLEENPDLRAELTTINSDSDGDSSPQHISLKPNTEVHLPGLPWFNTDELVNIDHDTDLATLAEGFYERPALTPGRLKAIDTANPALKLLNRSNSFKSFQKTVLYFFNPDSSPPKIPLKQGEKVKLPSVLAPLDLTLRNDVSFEQAEQILRDPDTNRLIEGIRYFSPISQLKLAKQEAVNSTVTSADWSEEDKHYLHFIEGDKVTSANLTGLAVPVEIAILDSGLDTQNPIVTSSLADDFDADADIKDCDAHGTHVSGLATGRMLALWRADVAATPINSFITFIPYKVTTESFTVDAGKAGKALNSVIQRRISIVNLSLTLPEEEQDGPGLLEQLVKSRIPRTTLIIAAAGNEGQTLSKKTRIYPASWYSDDDTPNLLVVAALDSSGKKLMKISNRGPGIVRIAAPGQDLFSTISTYANFTHPAHACPDVLHLTKLRICPTESPDTSPNPLCFGTFKGTSQAAPLVTFASAIIRAKNKDISAVDTIARLLRTCDWIPELKKDIPPFGCRLNLVKAISTDTDVLETDAGLLYGTLHSSFDVRYVNDNIPSAHTISIDDDSLDRIVFEQKTDQGVLAQLLLKGDDSPRSALVTTRTVQLELSNDAEKCPAGTRRSDHEKQPAVCSIQVDAVRDIVFSYKQVSHRKGESD